MSHRPETETETIIRWVVVSILLTLAFIAILFSAFGFMYCGLGFNQQSTEPTEVVYPTTTCRNCGTQFDSVSDPRGEDDFVDQCPMCPMGEEEFDEIIERLK